jgi:5,6,7,8-tetrahydromethanopterin hydro-lyase
LSFVTQVGEGFGGDGPDSAHVNTVLGAKGGPVETAWVTALATPRAGHVPFVVVMRNNLAVKPATLFVNKAEIRGDEHAALTWGAAQVGVARGVLTAVDEGVIPRDQVDDLLLIASIWIGWQAVDEEAVYENSFEATRMSLARGAVGEPQLEDVLASRDDPANAFFRRG